jgi:hypothetical protein
MRRLTLADWAAVSEIIGSVAIVLSLLFVGLELRRNTRSVQGATLQSVNEIARQQLLLHAADSNINRIYMVGDRDLSKLTSEERMRFFWLDRSFWLGMQTVFRQWQLGVLPDDEWKVYNTVICDNIKGAGTRAFWPQESRALIPAFVKIVEACEEYTVRPDSGASRWASPN